MQLELEREREISIMATGELELSKSLTIIKIQANPNDPMLFQSFFCVGCQDFILVNGLFPAPERHAAAHALAWVPAVDEPGPGRPIQAIEPWLRSAPLSKERRRYLKEVAPSSNSICWALILEPEEREEWFDYFSDYLENLADCWLDALNGKDSEYFRVEEIWLRPRPAVQFAWIAEESAEQYPDALIKAYASQSLDNA